MFIRIAVIVLLAGLILAPLFGEEYSIGNGRMPAYGLARQEVEADAISISRQDLDPPALEQVSVQGRVVGSDNPALGIANASVVLEGSSQYTATTDDVGVFFIPAVYAGQSYTYTISFFGYQILSGELHLGYSAHHMGNLILSELAYTPQNVSAVLSPWGDAVEIAWDAAYQPQSGWLHYDSGANYSFYTTGGTMNFDVAVRFPADSLVAHAGSYLRAIKFFPVWGEHYRLRVWRGGSAEEPGLLVLDQLVAPEMDQWNTMLLDSPVPITGDEELWFGFMVLVTWDNSAGAGFDYGPAVDGFGNMIYHMGMWRTLLSTNFNLNVNWNLQGYVGSGAPDSGIDELTPLGASPSQPREQLGYHVWRLLEDQIDNESTWIGITDEVTSLEQINDPAWGNLPNGSYLWAVRTVYNGGVMSEPAFSNPLQAVANSDEQAPTVETALLGNSPNPFRDGTLISYSLKEAAPLRLDIFDLRGRLVNSFSPGRQETGRGGIHWDGRDMHGKRVSSGIYFYRMQSGNFTSIRKMLILN